MRSMMQISITGDCITSRMPMGGGHYTFHTDGPQWESLPSDSVSALLCPLNFTAPLTFFSAV